MVLLCYTDLTHRGSTISTEHTRTVKPQTQRLHEVQDTSTRANPIQPYLYHELAPASVLYRQRIISAFPIAKASQPWSLTHFFSGSIRARYIPGSVSVVGTVATAPTIPSTTLRSWGVGGQSIQGAHVAQPSVMSSLHSQATGSDLNADGNCVAGQDQQDRDAEEGQLGPHAARELGDQRHEGGPRREDCHATHEAEGSLSGVRGSKHHWPPRPSPSRGKSTTTPHATQMRAMSTASTLP